MLTSLQSAEGQNVFETLGRSLTQNELAQSLTGMLFRC
jgi:hypothetical protein